MASDQPHRNNMIIDTNAEMLARLKDIASMVTHAAEASHIETVLERIAKVSSQLVHARYGALGIPDGQGRLRYFKVAGMTPEQMRKIGHLPEGHGLLGVIMNEREVVRIPHMQDDPRSCGFPEHHPHMESLLGVPVMMGDQLFGMLYLTDRIDGKPFSEQDQYVIEVMASYAALAIANSQLQEQRSKLALLEERERIMMELHDGVIQSLYAIGMQVDLMSNTSQNIDQEHELRRVMTGLNMVIEDIRSYIQNLRTMGEAKSIRECIDEILERVHIPAKLTVDIKVPSDLRPPLSATIFEAVCQIVHEALSNVVRHADSTRVEIDAGMQGDIFTLTIADNGKGFDANAATHRDGLGLRNLEQRARQHGGQVSIDSRLGEGTRMLLSIPVKPF